MRNFFNVGFLSLLSLFLIASSHSITNVGFGFGLPMQPHSVQGIARRFGIKYRVTKKIMSEESLDWIAQQKPDIILASCSQIFKKPLLEIPKIGCINRHSSLLPAYGGVFPVIQALLHGEKMIGCSIHLMTQKIDGGKLVAQSTVPVLPGDTVYSLYKKSYIDCGILALEAFDKLRDIPDREALATRDFGRAGESCQELFRGAFERRLAQLSNSRNSILLTVILFT